MADALSADDLVERLVGRRPDRPVKAVHAATAPVLLQLYGLPEAGGGQTELVIREGEIVSLYGAVGCGRERIAQSLAGLGPPPKGATATLRGRCFAPASPAAAVRSGVSYLPTGRAANGILPSRSIGENLMLSQLGRTGGHGLLSGRREREAVADQLRRLRTRYARASDLITRLSGGNQQKVLLGRALGRGADLVVLEDPTAGVDIGAKEDIHRQIRERAAAGTAFLLVSSDLGESIALSDLLVTVFDGRIAGRHVAPDPTDEPAIVAEILGATSPTATAHA